MKKLLVGVTAVVASVTCFALETNVWTGNAGNFLWSDMANWKKQGGGDPIAPSVATTADAPCWDFSALPADSTVTNDYEGLLNMGGLTFGENQGTITFVSTKSSQQLNFVKANAAPWIYPIVKIPSGTTVDLRARYSGGWNQSQVTFKGGGTFKINGDFTHDTVLRLFIEDITFVVGKDWPAASGATFTYIRLDHDNAIFKMEQDRMFGYVMTKAGVRPKMYLNGHALTMRLGENGGAGITNNAEIVTGGTIAMRYNRLNVLSGGFAADCAPMTFSMDNADLDIGGADNPITLPLGSRYVGNYNGRLGLFADQDFASLSSTSPAGGLSIAADKVLTVSGTADKVETMRAPITGGGKVTVKAPANYELKLTGANDFAPTFRVESGKVSTARPYRDAEGLVAYWTFDDDETGKDPRCVTPGRTILSSIMGNTSRVAFDTVGIGGIGQCAHFDFDPTKWCEGEGGPFDANARKSIVAMTKDVGDAELLKMTNDHTVVMYIRPDVSTMDGSFAPRLNADGKPVMEVFYNCWPNENTTPKEKGMMWVSFQGTNELFFSGMKDDQSSAIVISDLAKKGITPFDGKWHQLAFSYESATRTHRAFYDGSNIYSRVRVDDYHFFLRDNVRFGARVTHNKAYNQCFHGDMDNLQFWNRVLSDKEIAEDWRLLGNIPGRNTYGKTAPIAHWKFDDSNAIGKDSSGNGYDLTAVAGSGWGIVTKTASLCPGLNGLAAQIPTLNNGQGSHLVCDIPAKLPTDNSFSLTIRLQQFGGVAENKNAAFFLGSPEDQKFLELHLSNWLPYVTINAFGAGYSEQTAYQIAGSPSGKTAALSGWMDFAFVYNKPNKTFKIYKDGILIKTWTAYAAYDLGSDPKFYIGYSPKTGGWFPEYVDDCRLYDRVLTDADVQEVVRELSNAGKATDNVLPANSEPAVVGTGVLELGANQTVRKIWGGGQGTLSLPWANLTVTEECQFGGVLSGCGTIYAEKAFSLSGSGPDFFGKVVAEKSFSANDKFPNATFTMPEGTQITRVGNETDPYFNMASGTVEIPATGSLTVTGTDYPKDERIVLARGTSVSAPSGLDGWTATLPEGKSGRFYVKDGDFGFKIHGGMVLLIK